MIYHTAFRISAVLPLLVCLAGQPAFSQAEPGDEPAVSAALDVAWVSKYVWRGIELNPDPVIQPSLTVSHRSGLSFNWWGSMDTTRVFGQRGNFTEIDYTLSYAWSTRGVGMSAGLINYTFPNTEFASTAEAFLSAEFEGALSPALSINYDFDEADGFYLSLSLSRSWELSGTNGKPAGIDLSARVSFASSDYVEAYFPGASGSSLSDLLISAAVPVKLSDVVTITPAISWSTLLDSDLKDAAGKSSIFFAGITVSAAF